MNSYTIFDHAQYGHDETVRRPKKRKSSYKPTGRKIGRPRKPKWFDTLGLGPQFNKPKRASA